MPHGTAHKDGTVLKLTPSGPDGPATSGLNGYVMGQQPARRGAYTRITYVQSDGTCFTEEGWSEAWPADAAADAAVTERAQA